ncbi:hypothetical protein NIES267_40870 [Calothrix parasitica NIES-267]|uniref:Uncharacterized protein n=1 Tax=Calothrix parasitica NIES-267 TaxID=1973488 RepID=A0A1Z4LTV5_9CYAN|nr:hypothetical protein NIES267_40870 [Calothrix parasitica NIES-267]
MRQLRGIVAEQPAAACLSSEVNQVLAEVYRLFDLN